MMISKISLLLAVAPLAVNAFRAPDNAQLNVKLPKIAKTASPEKAALLSPPKPTKDQNDVPAFEDIVDVKMPDSVLAKNIHSAKYKRWGIDNENNLEYWNDCRIHTLGNVGFWGGVHAILAPLSTRMIDMVAYNGTDVRYLVSKSEIAAFNFDQAYQVFSLQLFFCCFFSDPLGSRRIIEKSQVQQGTSC